jgi:hypothetical protein
LRATNGLIDHVVYTRRSAGLAGRDDDGCCGHLIFAGDALASGCHRAAVQSVALRPFRSHPHGFQRQSLQRQSFQRQSFQRQSLAGDRRAAAARLARSLQRCQGSQRSQGSFGCGRLFARHDHGRPRHVGDDYATYSARQLPTQHGLVRARAMPSLAKCNGSVLFARDPLAARKTRATVQRSSAAAMRWACSLGSIGCMLAASCRRSDAQASRGQRQVLANTMQIPHA